MVSYHEYYARIGVVVPHMSAVVRAAIRNSARSGYHKQHQYKLQWAQLAELRQTEADLLKSSRGSSAEEYNQAEQQWHSTMAMANAVATANATLRKDKMSDNANPATVQTRPQCGA